jgi:hypothetical protein
MLGPFAYIAGWASVVMVVAVLAWGAWSLRSALLPEWSGTAARLAEVVIIVAVPVALSQLLGSFSAFRWGPVFAACVIGGIGIGVVGRQIAKSHPSRAGGRCDAVNRTADSPTRPVRGEIVAAILATALVGAQWASHVAVALSRGMTHVDTLWYHGAYAAEFAQDGRLTDVLDRTDALHAYATHNSELIHALFLLPFGRDILSPLLNLGWAALALLAAWCTGRHRGVAVPSLLGCVLVLGLPIAAGTHPGQASNDVAAAALLLAAVALLLEDPLAPVPTALAAVAAGLAVGTKLTVAAPVGLLSVGIVVLAVRARRPKTAALWCVLVAVFGGYWFLRNIAAVRNPLPYFSFHFGPLSLPAPARNPGATVASYLTDGHVWREFFLPGLSSGLGRGWVIVLALALGGAVFVVIRGRNSLERLTAAMVLVGAIAYVFTPLTAAGGGLSFVFNLRYLIPVLVVGFALWPLMLDAASAFQRQTVCVCLLGLIALDATAANHERMRAWPWGHLLAGVLVGAGVVGAVLLLVYLARRVDTPRFVVAAFLVVAAGVAVSWPVQRRYLEHRYIDAGLHTDAINAYFRDVHHAQVAVIGTVEAYPMFGLDLSNRVTKLVGRSDSGGRDPCREWRQLLSGKYRYVVLTTFGLVGASRPPQEWFTEDPAATVVARDGDSVAYHLTGALHPPDCSRGRR